MATFYLTRKDFPALTLGTLTTKATAFRTLYCGASPTDPKLLMFIRGDWPEQFKGAGFWSSTSKTEIVSIGRKFLTVRFEDDGVKRFLRLTLCPTNDTGFTEIMFMTDR